jgi:hypothetical protein
VFLFFAGMMAIMTMWVWLFLPETKGVPVEEIMTVWARLDPFLLPAPLNAKQQAS